LLRPLLCLIGTLLVTQAAAIATSAYLHRGLAHRALRLHPLADWGFRFVLWFTTGQNRREWVAVHRKRYAFTDTEKDPHSPLVHDFWMIQLWNVYYYVREARNPDTLNRWAKDIRDDVWARALFNRGTLGGAFGIAAALLVLGPGWGLLLALSHLILYVFVLAPSINGLAHG
jgi:stearoyl-CoA desaturase (Delta-9 desaturase)